MKKLILSCLLLYPIYAQSQVKFTGDLATDLRILLPRDSIVLDVMDLEGTPRFMELLTKLQSPVRYNQKWVEKNFPKIGRGDTVDYDPKLGLSEEEYAEFVHLWRDFKWVPKGHALLRVLHTDTAIRFKFFGDTFTIGEFYIRSNQERLIVPKARMKYRGVVEPNPMQIITGPFVSHFWEKATSDILDENAPLDVTTYFYHAFYIGQIIGTGEGIIYYRVRKIEARKNSKRSSETYWMFRYRLNK